MNSIVVASVHDQKNSTLYANHYSSEEEARAFVKTYEEEARASVKTYEEFEKGWGWLQGLVIPLRTQNGEELIEDLFFPTFAHVARKVDNIALKVMVAIFAIALDIMTLPIRSVTTPFRIWYHAYYPEKDHRLVRLIKENKEAQVDLNYKIQKINFVLPTEENQFTTNVTRCVVKGTLHLTSPDGTQERSPEVEEIMPPEQINFLSSSPWLTGEKLSGFIAGYFLKS